MQRTVTRNGKRIPLTTKKYELLLSLARHTYLGNKNPLPAHQLIKDMYGRHPPSSNTVSVLLNRVRDLLKESQSETEIHTIRGEGYRLVSTFIDLTPPV